MISYYIYQFPKETELYPHSPTYNLTSHLKTNHQFYFLNFQSLSVILSALGAKFCKQMIATFADQSKLFSKGHDSWRLRQDVDMKLGVLY